MRQLTQAIVDRYSFLKYPQTFEDYQVEGIQFAGGMFEEFDIHEMRFFPNGVVISTGGTTDVGHRLFNDLTLTWREYGLRFEPHFIRDVRYLSELVVRSEAFGAVLKPAILDILREHFGPATALGDYSFSVGPERGNQPIQIQPLREAPPDEHHYWCQAPLTTARHEEFLAAFARAIG
jgi:hypothetical protein